MTVRHAAGARPPDDARPATRSAPGRSAAARLVAIKAVHSAVFWVELVSIGWLLLSGARGRRDRSVAVAAGLVAAESVVWLANDRICPLTPLAERYGASNGSVSDIWLPDVVARTIPQWSISLLAIAALLHLRGLARR